MRVRGPHSLRGRGGDPEQPYYEARPQPAVARRAKRLGIAAAGAALAIGLAGAVGKRALSG